MNIREKALQAVFWAVLRGGGHRVITLAVFVVLARLLDPEAFGLVALAGVFIAFTELFMGIGFGAAIIQRRELEAAHLDTAFWTILAIGGISAIGCFGAAGWIASLFDKPALAPVLRWLSLGIFFASLTRVQESLLQRDLNFKALAARMLAASAAGGAGGVGMAMNGLGVWSLVGQQLIGAAAGVLVLWAVSRWRPRLQYSTERLRELFDFGVHVMGSNVMHFVNEHADRLLIGYFLGPATLGYYTVGQRLIVIIQQVTSKTFALVLYPMFSRIQDDEARIRRVLSTAVQVTALGAFPVFIFLSVAGPETVHVLFGARWSASAPVLQILAVAGLLQSIVMFVDPMFKARGKPSWAFKVAVVRAMVGVTMFASAVRWGIVGVAFAWVAREVLLVFFSLRLAKRLVALDVVAYMRGLLGPFAGALAVAVGVLLAKNVVDAAPGDEAALLGGLVLASVVYIVVVLLVQPSLVKKAIAMAWLTLPVKRLPKT